MQMEVIHSLTRRKMALSELRPGTRQVKWMESTATSIRMVPCRRSNTNLETIGAPGHPFR